MLNRLFYIFVVLPLGVLLVVFAIANRHAVTLSLDPFGAASPSLSATMPLFILIMLMLLIGVLVGGFATWLSQARWRKATRHLSEEARALRRERSVLRAQLAAQEATMREATMREVAARETATADMTRRGYTPLPALPHDRLTAQPEATSL